MESLDQMEETTTAAEAVAAAAAAATHPLGVLHPTKVTRMATHQEGLLRSQAAMRHHQILGLSKATTQDRNRTNHRRSQAGSDRICLPGVRMQTQDRTQGAIQTQDRIQGAIQKLDRVQADIKIQTQGRTQIQIRMQMQMQNPGGKRHAKKLANEKRSVKLPRLCDRRKRRMRSG